MKALLAAVGRAQMRALCAILYYGVLTPYALALRLFGVKFLETELEPDRPSYWKDRPRSDPAETARRLD